MRPLACGNDLLRSLGRSRGGPSHPRPGPTDPDHASQVAGSLMSDLFKQPSWDPSQFKLQTDGTFRISIRGMAAMAGVDQSGLTRSLKSAEDENPLPCARSLMSQGFCPEDVSTWGETGGIPEDAAPFILEHYGITASNPSQQARMVLLAFSRVGINAYLKERLGVSQVRDTQPLLPDVLTTVERSITLLEKLGGIDDRAQMMLKDIVLNHAARNAGSELALPGVKMLSLQEAFQQLGGASPKEATKLANQHGRLVKQVYREENGRPPKTHKQLVHGRNCDVCDYEFQWLQTHESDLVELVEKFRTQFLNNHG